MWGNIRPTVLNSSGTMTSKATPLYAIKAGDIVRVDYGTNSSTGSRSMGPATIGGSETEGIFLILDNICHRDGYHNTNYVSKAMCLSSKNRDEPVGNVEFRYFSSRLEVIQITQDEIDLLNLA